MSPVAGGPNSSWQCRMKMFDAAMLSDVGQKRSNNEDCFAYFIPESSDLLEERGALFAVADGMGGAVAGEVASKTTLDIFVQDYLEDSKDDLWISGQLKRAVEKANKALTEKARQDESLRGMGTTLSALILSAGWAYIVQVGDSRVYLSRSGKLYQLTEDHSLVAEQLRMGLITEEEARDHQHKNLITRAVGISESVEPDMFALRYKRGDTFLLCSDGLHVVVDDELILGSLNERHALKSCQKLINRANERGGPDNITVGVVRVKHVGKRGPLRADGSVRMIGVEEGLLSKLWGGLT